MSIWLYKTGVKDGSPWIDNKSGTKNEYEIFFVFKIENFVRFILRDVCVSYSAVAASGNSQLPLKMKVQVSSSQNDYFPKNIPVELLSSPSQDFNLGTLDEESTGTRKAIVALNMICGKGDVITVTVSGDTTGIPVNCTIFGRKYEA